MFNSDHKLRFHVNIFTTYLRRHPSVNIFVLGLYDYFKLRINYETFMHIKMKIGPFVNILTHQDSNRFAISLYISLYGPRHSKKCFRAYADCEAPDQPTRPHSLIRAFTPLTLIGY